MKNLALIIIVFFSFNSAAQVTSVTGTANQIITSGSTGAVTLALPQSIATTSSPRFTKLGVGSGVSAITSFYNTAPITGGATSVGNYIQSEIRSDVTSIAYGNFTALNTQATSFSLGHLIHYGSYQNSIGSGSSVVNQYGFHVNQSLIGATFNYGFYGNIPAASGRWNLYMNGTASNYLAGNLGIGTTNPTEKLSVNGNIRAKEIRVEASPWPDYVFHKSYSLQPLSEVEKFIAANQHLPGIPSASEIEKDGLNLGEMNARLLQKIEELTLYMIELKKENIAHTKEIDLLKAKLK